MAYLDDPWVQQRELVMNHLPTVEENCEEVFSIEPQSHDVLWSELILNQYLNNCAFFSVVAVRPRVIIRNNVTKQVWHF